MKRISKVNWSWDYGKVKSEITFTNGETEVRINEEKPPTYASHDIAHFICGFHKKYEWDYLNEQESRLAEFNSVFLENILFFYIENKHDSKGGWPMYMMADSIDKHMKWFVEDYYKFGVPHVKLIKRFLSMLEIPVVIQHYKPFYSVFIKELKFPKGGDVRDMKVSVTMDETLDYEDQELYDYLVEMRDILGD